MDVVLHAVYLAAGEITQPERMLFLGFGVCIGLMIGILPGMSGIAGMALLLPFTYNMDPVTAIAFLLGLGSVTTTSDVMTAVLFGVPGHASAQATVLEGYPMSKRGEAGRALSACYAAAMLGGLFGAVILGVALPLLRPVMLYIGSPELLAAALFGISMVASLSGSAPLRGLVAAGLGITFAMVGADPQTGTLRWTLGTLYLWDGLPLLPVALGLFALPELCDLSISRSAVSKIATLEIKSGMVQGFRDTLRHWFLAVRCGSIGSAIGAVPGLGSAVVGWLAYAHALRTEKDAAKTFGKGDVRGLIATEAANNAKEGGALIPTIAFGVPGSASMAILLGAFLIHGLVPGPEMLERNLDVTYTMVWSVVVANILGAGLCFLFSGFFAKVTTLRYTLIIPIILVIVYVGAFQASRDWGDLYTLFFFGVLGWLMKQLRWPRPPLILGFVLGETIERYMFISTGRYDWEWLLHPIVIVLLSMAVLSFIRPFLSHIRQAGGVEKLFTGFSKPLFKAADIFPIVLIVMLVYMYSETVEWEYGARLVPLFVGLIMVPALLISFLNEVFRRAPDTGLEHDAAEDAKEEIEEKLHMDIAADHGSLTTGEVIRRAGIYLGWVLALMASIGLIGFIPTAPLFIIAYMKLERNEPWWLAIAVGLGMGLFLYFIFNQVLSVIWPGTYLGEWIPALRVIPSV